MIPMNSSRSHPHIGVVGLGLMGTALTHRLLEHGWPVAVWNRSREKADPLLAAGATWTDRPFADCDRVILSLYSSDVVRDVIDQFSPDLRPGQVIVDTTTGEPADGEELATRLRQRGVACLEAPISGSSEQTRRGEALVLVGGNRADFDRSTDLWECLARQVIYTGDSGSASRMKLVSNLVLGLNRAALAEGLAFARSTGVDPAAALEVLRNSAAASRVMDVKGQKMLTGDFTPAARLSQHLKDVRIILATAERAGQPLPLSALHRTLLERAESLGLGELDNSAIARVFERETPR